MPSSLKVLVTGGSGLIGRAVVRRLQDEGHEVVVFDSSDAGCPCDVRDLGTVTTAMRGCDVVVHLAGIAGPELAEPSVGYDINARGTFTVFQAAADVGVRKVVYASSINASGLPLGGEPALPRRFPYDEDEPVRLADWYSLSKVANEDAARMFHARYAIEFTGLRFPLTRDIRSDGGADFGADIRRLLKQSPLRAAAEGWSYLDTDDAAIAVNAAIRAITPPSPGALVAAPMTYLEIETSEAVAALAPSVPSVIEGRNVGLKLERAREWLGFEARSTLEAIAPDAIVTRREWQA